MNEQLFYQTINEKAQELNMNPLLILSGIEGLYTFKDVQLNKINYDFLDSLILTIFALRIGDQFHTLAEENLQSGNLRVREAAAMEMSEMSADDIRLSLNPYLQSFAGILNGKSIIRKYHEKALEVAAIEIKKAQLLFEAESISTIILGVCHRDLQDLDLGALFS